MPSQPQQSPPSTLKIAQTRSKTRVSFLGLRPNLIGRLFLDNLYSRFSQLFNINLGSFQLTTVGSARALISSTGKIKVDPFPVTFRRSSGKQQLFLIIYCKLTKQSKRCRIRGTVSAVECAFDSLVQVQRSPTGPVGLSLRKRLRKLSGRSELSPMSTSGTTGGNV